jgi:hypothetical protein
MTALAETAALRVGMTAPAETAALRRDMTALGRRRPAGRSSH